MRLITARVLYAFGNSSKASQDVRSETILNFQFGYQISLFLLLIDEECSYSLNHQSYPQEDFVMKPPEPANQDFCTNMCRNLAACYLPNILNSIEYFCN